MPAPFAWSYSRLLKFEQCPKQFWHMNVMKDVKEVPTEQQDWGTFVHKAFEDRVAKQKPLPEDLQKHEDLVAALTSGTPRQILVEQQWALTRDLRPTGWFDRNVWCRFKGDLVRVDPTPVNGAAPPLPEDVALLVDYKTGKIKEDESQLKLGAAFTFEHFPTVGLVKSLFLWVKTEALSRLDVLRRDKPQIWAEFMPRVARMEKAYNEADMPAQPSPLCNWCPVTACAHNPRNRG